MFCIAEERNHLHCYGQKTFALFSFFFFFLYGSFFCFLFSTLQLLSLKSYKIASSIKDDKKYTVRIKQTL